MRHVNVSARDGRPIADFAILPWTNVAPGMVEEQFKVARELARGDFYFLVTSDRLYGWTRADGHRFFDEPTERVLARYAGSPEGVLKAGTEYLAALVESWTIDLMRGTRTVETPERGLSDAGFIQELRGP